VSKPVKRVELARAAVDLVRREMPDVELKVATGLPHDRMPLLAGACDVLLLTSTHEGWPNIVKEALACNTPFVATDVGDLPSIAEIEPTCHVVEPDPDALAGALANTLSRPRPSDLRRHVEPMGVAVTAQRLICIYEGLLS
jgi:glycosyltransferase involved in cell wall biosynthesis